METDIELREVRVGDLESFNEALNEVCAERQYMAIAHGIPLEIHRAFLQIVITNRLPQVVAVEHQKIVGWCDVIPHVEEGFTHIGRLGMGVRMSYRGRGIGRELLSECLRHAGRYGLEKVELEVFENNAVAIRLYEAFGFRREGCKAKARKLDGCYQDSILMGLLIGAGGR
ncbi:MAG: GNAT family N-acetyltransferase [Gammaproteobacteria bacterium]